MRPRTVSAANRSRERLQATSTGVLTDAKRVKRTAYARKKGFVRNISKGFFRNIHLSKRKRKNIQSAMLFFAMLIAFSLFSICFGDAVLSPDDPPSVKPTEDTTASVSARASVTVDEEKSLFSNERTSAPVGMAVFYSANGSRYHLTATCSGMKEAKEADLSQAKAWGLTPCKRCDPPE